MDIAIFSCLSLASWGGLVHFWQKVSQEKLKLKEIQDAKIFSPHRLLKSFKKTEFRSKARRNPENPDEYLLKVFLEGSVECKNPIKSTINKQTDLVHRIYFREDIHSNTTFSSDLESAFEKKGTEVNAPLVFHLKDPMTNEYCQIHRAFNVNSTYAIEPIAEHKELKEPNWFEYILIAIAATMNIKGVKIGWSEKEFGIRVNNALTVYGEVIYNIQDQSLRMDSPFYYLLEKRNILNDVKDIIRGTNVKMALMMIPFTISCFFLYRAISARIRKFWNKRNEPSDQLNHLKKVVLKDDYKCTNCNQRGKDVIFKPCLHFILCSQCNTTKAGDPCPVCNEKITNVVHIFFS